MTVEEILQLARGKGLRIATAESCTGGLIAAALTAVPGSSDVVECGFVTYSNSAKVSMLGVSQKTLDQFGAVSEEVAREMADGARTHSKADIAVSVTGIAGPGGSEFKPEGRVCFGIASATGTRTILKDFGALGRDAVRQASVDFALKILADAADKS